MNVLSIDAETNYREAFKATLDSSSTLGPDLESRLSTIQALALSEQYLSAPLKVMIMGQETAGNYARLDAIDRTPSGWQNHQYESAVADVRDFDYGYSKSQGSSPWWSAYQEICDHYGLASRRETAWTNISKVQLWDDSAGSVSISTLSSANQMAVLKWQKQLVRAEIDYARPDIIIMLTGGMSWMACHLFDQLDGGKFADKVGIEGAPRNTMGLRSTSLPNAVAGFTLHPGARISNDEKARLRALLISWLDESRAVMPETRL